MSPDAPASPFAGFQTEALAFYLGLEADNSRTYWTDHKDVWEREVRGPMLALVAALADEFGEAKLFRPNRDIRFSADKSPYKTHQGAFAATPGGAGYYVQISAKGLRAVGIRAHNQAQTGQASCGCRCGSPGSRAGDPAGVTTPQPDSKSSGKAVKTTPRGYAADHPRIELLRHKELMVIRDFGDLTWLGTRRALARVRDTWRSVSPLNEWVATHVGPPASD